MRIFIVILISLFCFSIIGKAQDNGHKIDISISNYDVDTLIIGYYFADRQLIKDTLYAQDGSFTLQGDEPLYPGVYLFLLSPWSEYVQFLVPIDDQHFEIKGDMNDLKHLDYIGSDENDLFQDYLDFLNVKRTKIESLTKEKEGANEKTIASIEESQKEVNSLVQKEQQRILQEFPQSITSNLIKGNLEMEIPPFDDLNDQERKLARFEYYKAHYFDHIDLGDSINLHTPFLDDRVNYYLNKLTTQLSDSINVSIDYLLSAMKPETPTYRYYLGQFYNKYAKSKVVGMDAVIVHLVDQYYGVEGMTPWVDEKNLAKIIENANKIRPTLMGQIAQDITVFQEDGTPITLSSIESEYTVLLFWAPDCGHCKKVMPSVVEFQEAFRDRGVTVFAICTKHQEKMATCWESVKEKNMTGFINAADEFHRSRFKTKFDVRTTPKVFILDANMEILIKGIGGEQLTEVMESIIKEKSN